MRYKIGMGSDIHRIHPVAVEREIAVGGLTLKAHYAIEAHSDGDVILHALVDAILGTCGMGDIGEHFPPSDPNYKDKDSKYFLDQALAILRRCDGTISNVDIIFVAQSIRLFSFKKRIQSFLAEYLSLDARDVNIKAKTNEKIGCLGRDEGIAAYAIVLSTFPS